MLRKVSTRPIIKTTFLLVDPGSAYTADTVTRENNSVVTFWFDIEAKGIKWRSEYAPAQIQHQGKFLRGVRECPFWNDDSLARLSVSTERVARVNSALADYRVLDDRLPSPRALVLEVTDSIEQLESLWKEMATPDFFTFFNNVLFPLQREDSTDERTYALYKGTVWSCSRELEPKQWTLLADRFVEREDMELAAALAGDESSQIRERISTEVRRAVWIRDQGQCARCGSRERLELDHIVPLSRGGSNTERNIELLCEVCNRAKSDAIL